MNPIPYLTLVTTPDQSIFEGERMTYAIGNRVDHFVEPTERNIKEGTKPVSFGPGIVILVQARKYGHADLITVRFDSGQVSRFVFDTNKLSLAA